MHAFSALFVALEAATPTPTMTVDPESVTPGFVGFIAIGLITAAVVFLLIDMLRRIRRAGYRADINEELDAEEQADAAVRATDVDDQDIDPPVDPPADPPAPRNS